MQYPVDEKWPITQAFGVVAQIYTDLGYRGHHGCDIGTPVGTEVHAAALWECVSFGHDDPTAGNFIVLRHSKGILTRYLHLSRIDVGAGDTGPSGHPIGLSGDTGLVDGPHLHFEVIVPWLMGNGYKGRVNPEIYFAEEHPMTNEQREEIQRIVEIFDGWANILTARKEQAETIGYGITDSFSERLSAELRGATDGLRKLIP